MTASEVRVPHARLLVVAGALAAGAAILWLARGFTFYFDEWDFILHAPDWQWVSYLQPHNEHPAMLHRAVYSALLATVGLRSYLPYMAVLVALHGTSAVLLFELVRRRSGDLAGIACAAVLLVLGAGWEDLLWAFQMAWVGSVACGLGALLALNGSRHEPRMLPATVLVGASLMFSGIGLFFAVAAVVQLAANPSRRRRLLCFLPLGFAVGLWYVALGRSGALPNPPPTAGNVVLAPLYTLWGLGASAAGLVGEGGSWGPAVLVAAAGTVGWTWWRHGTDPYAWSVLAALVALYLVTSLSRAQLGYQQSAAGRYVYVGAVFWLILLADAAGHLPWRGTWRPALVACLFLAGFNSGVLLFAYSAAKTEQMQREVADLQALSAERTDPCLNPSGAVDLLVMPQVTNPSLYYRAIDRYGDPSASLPISDQADFERARKNLHKLGC
ncbi:hypothetical protein EPN29_11950 [bacterium]|nr:MAG: hypothetical protein EPN29_11950 [bacterium]